MFNTLVSPSTQASICSRCGGGTPTFFLLEEQPICTTCCDSFTTEELLHFTGAASLCDLLYDLGYCTQTSTDLI